MSAADSGSDPSPSAVASFKSVWRARKTDSSALGFLVTIFTVRDPSFRVGLSENFWCAPVLCVKYIRVNSCVGGKHAPSVCTLRTDDRRPTTDDRRERWTRARRREENERADAMANATDPLARSVRGMNPQVRRRRRRKRNPTDGFGWQTEGLC